MNSERPNNGVLGSLGLSAIMQCLHGITDHKPNSIAQRLYVVQRYRHKILHVERHLRQLTMSLTRVCLRLAGKYLFDWHDICNSVIFGVVEYECELKIQKFKMVFDVAEIQNGGSNVAD